MLPDHAGSRVAGSIPGRALEGSQSSLWQFPPASQMPLLSGNQHLHNKMEKVERAATPRLLQGNRCPCSRTFPG